MLAMSVEAISQVDVSLEERVETSVTPNEPLAAVSYSLFGLNGLVDLGVRERFGVQ